MQIFWLNDVPPALLGELGGKARGLYYLEKHGFKTPKGFVAFEIQDEDEIEALATFWQDSNLTCVAVRSSATREDGSEFSSAGQYQTFLNINNREAFIEAVKDCLASLESDNVKEYRAFAGQGKSKMALVVQEMIEATYAGVAFSINPMTKSDEVVIEAVEGLGEQLVSGLKQAYSYKINRFTPNFDGDFLNQQHVKEIFECALKAEHKWEIPLDLEWAIDQHGTLIWLQARPITTLEDVDINELDSQHHDENDTITNHNVGEMLPGAITPLTISTVVYAIDYGLRKMLTVVGVRRRLKDIPPAFCVSNYYGHLFFNMRYLYQIPDVLVATDRESIDIGICGQPLEHKGASTAKKPFITTRLFNFMRYGAFLMSSKRARKKIDRLARSIEFSHDSSAENLIKKIDQKLDVLNNIMLLHYITSGHSGAMSSAIFTILKKDYPDHDYVKSLIAGVLEDIDDIESADILFSLRRIALLSKIDQPQVVNYTPSELLEYYENSRARVKDAYQHFLNKHGHRAVKEAELRNPGWKDDKLSLMSNIQVVLQQKDISIEKVSHLSSNREKLLSGYKGSKKRALNYLIDSARDGCRNREYSKSRLVLAADRFKLAYKTLAKKLVEQGLMNDEDLIYFLTHEEVKQLVLEGQNSLIKKALSRRRLFAEQSRLKFNHVYHGRPSPLVVDIASLKVGETLKGTTLSRGKVFGRARVVLSLEDAKNLQQDEIMIAGYTDIGWSPYYAIIGGLVTEVGSALSHGAVVAREYSLPLISNVLHVTSKIKTGDMLALDADAGTITIVE